MSAGIALGSKSVNCSCRPFSGQGGQAGTVGAGFTVSDLVALGAEMHYWATPIVSNVHDAQFFAVAVAQVYPFGRSLSAARGLFLKTGLGLSHDPGKSVNGTAGLAGVGFDISIGNRVALTPFASCLRAVSGRLPGGAPDAARDWRPRVSEVGLSLML